MTPACYLCAKRKGCLACQFGATMPNAKLCPNFKEETHAKPL